MTATWTCHRCGVRHVDSDPERDLPEGWCSFFVTTVDEGEIADRQVDLYFDGEAHDNLVFCVPCSNIAIEALVDMQVAR